MDELTITVSEDFVDLVNVAGMAETSYGVPRVSLFSCCYRLDVVGY